MRWPHETYVSMTYGSYAYRTRMLLRHRSHKTALYNFFFFGENKSFYEKNQDMNRWFSTSTAFQVVSWRGDYLIIEKFMN